MNYSAPRFLFRRHEIVRRIEASGSFIEIGAGNLAFSRELLGYFERGLAVDFTDDLLDFYEKLPGECRSKLQVRNANFMRDDIGGRFDCVIACEVMEHIEDDRGFLSKVRGLLEPGGQAIISVPARDKFWSVHDELVGHIRRYEKADLIKKGLDAGFERISVVSYGYPWINLLRIPRIWLARRSLASRKDWGKEKQTSMSNHRQIPTWLTRSAVPLLVNRFTIFPLALISGLFNNMDRSNGYIMDMRTAGDQNQSGLKKNAQWRESSGQRKPRSV